MERLPIPSLTDDQDDNISVVVKQLIDITQQRYMVRQKTAHRLQRDLGNSNLKLNQKLEEWWLLSFNDFRNEVKKVFKQDIPLRDRDDWEELLQERRSEIARLTSEIIRLETDLNAIVYTAFDLNEDEIKLIEQETKFSYGEW
jgi:Ser-tRNA(Ala) deacylase AlaX